MAAPDHLSLKNMNGTSWTFNPALSGDYGSVLALQEVNFLVRAILARTSFTVNVKQWEEDGVTRLELENLLSTALPGVTDKLILNWEPDEFYDNMFGNVRDRTRWIKVDDLEEEYHREGWEDGTTEVIEIRTDHLDINASTSQVCGFETIDGLRHYVRKVVARKGDECIQIRLTFNYVETVETATTSDVAKAESMATVNEVEIDV